MIRLVLIVVILVLVVRLVLRLMPRRIPLITTTSSGVAVRGGGIAWFVSWNEIRQIDICRMPTPVVEKFEVVLFANTAVTVYDSYAGFADFTRVMFARWPGIQAEWARVFTGPPDISEHVTLWVRP